MSSEGQQNIVYATSPDGIHWTREADGPVVTAGHAGDWDAAQADEPTVIYVPSIRRYQMWYVGRPEGGRRQIGLAMATTACTTYLPLIRR